jgi:hypothetical protein
MHANKGKSIARCLKDRTDYAVNEEKTQQGKYISSYACNVELADKEFAQSKKEYFQWTGRKPKGDIIAYQIRQSFKPGEITPEEANQIGYETAMRFTKGEHAFIVATHIDRAHVHNHIIFNSTNLSCDRKFRNSWFIALALQRLSDLVCLEHGLSVIKPRKPGEREKYTKYPKKETIRSRICEDIEKVLLQRPENFEEFLQRMREEHYEIKTGKYPALKSADQNRFIRFRSLGTGYTQEDLEKRIIEIFSDGKQAQKKENSKKKYPAKREFDLLIDIQEKMKQGKGGGYTKWATVYNIKQMAQTLLFLQERDIRDYDVLAQKADGASKHFRELSQEIKDAEKRLGEIAVIKNHVLTYVKNREIFVAYKKYGYSKRFFAEHERELLLYKAAREAFENLPEKKVPKIKELNDEYGKLLSRKKELYSEYRQSKKEMQDFVTAKHNIDSFLRVQDPEQSSEKSKLHERENKKNTER